MFWQPLLPLSEVLLLSCNYGRQLVVIDVWKLLGPLVSGHCLVQFFPELYHFSDLPVHSVAFFQVRSLVSFSVWYPLSKIFRRMAGLCQECIVLQEDICQKYAVA